MRPESKVLGIGFAEPYWWTQDFGMCASGNNSVIVSGCHDFLVCSILAILAKMSIFVYEDGCFISSCNYTLRMGVRSYLWLCWR